MGLKALSTHSLAEDHFQEADCGEAIPIYRDTCTPICCRCVHNTFLRLLTASAAG
jgi:hypothetical protein